MPDLWAEGEKHLAAGRLDKARECFLGQLQSIPASLPARRSLARLEADAGRLADARRWAEEAVLLAPLDGALHYFLGIIHQAGEEYEESLAWFKKAVYLEPDFVLAHFRIAHLYERTGQHKEAARHRRLASRLTRRLAPDAVLPGADDGMTAGQLSALLQNRPGEA